MKLDLPTRTRRFCSEKNINSLFDFLNVLEEGFIRYPSVGRKTIEQTRLSLLDAVKDDEIIFKYVLSRFENLDKEMKSPSSLQIVKNFIETYPSEVEQISLLEIPFSGKVKRLINEHKTRTVKELVDQITSPLFIDKKIGDRTVSDTLYWLLITFYSLDVDNENILASFRDERKVCLSECSGDFIPNMNAVIERILSKKEPRKHKIYFDIIQKRFGLGSDKVYTLEDIGCYYNITRERVRQVEERFINDLEKALSGRFKSNEWKVSQEVVDKFKNLKMRIEEFDLIILEPELFDIFYDVGLSTPGNGELNLLLKLFNLDSLPEKVTHFSGNLKNGWFRLTQASRVKLENHFRKLELVFESIEPKPIFDITIKIKKSISVGFAEKRLREMIKACVELEESDNYVFIKSTHLKNISDKAYFVLKSNQERMHFKEITRRINSELGSVSAKFYKPNYIINSMAKDDRFDCIGKSGFWSLVEWSNHSNVTILEAITDFLHSNGAPAKLSEICAAVKELRPDSSEKSVYTYLNTKSDTFARTTSGEYGLTTWGNVEFKKSTKTKRVSDDEFYKVIIDVFSEKSRIRLSLLIELLSRRLGLSKAGARQKINNSPFIHTEEIEGTHAKMAVCNNTNFDWKSSSRKLLKDKIHEEVRRILLENPETQLTKGQMYFKVSEKVKCIRPTFYAYLSSMDDIEQSKVGNNYYVKYNISKDFPMVFDEKHRKFFSSEDVVGVVKKIILKFKDLIENNGIWKNLWESHTKVVSEPKVQRLFFAIAQSYCSAYNLDITPEANSGNGPVDFKFSHGFHLRILVEIKMSTNSRVLKGFSRQLEYYKQSEGALYTFYLIIAMKKSHLSMVDRLDASKHINSEALIIDGSPRLPGSIR